LLKELQVLTTLSLNNFCKRIALFPLAGETAHRCLDKSNFGSFSGLKNPAIDEKTLINRLAMFVLNAFCQASFLSREEMMRSFLENLINYMSFFQASFLGIFQSSFLGFLS